MRIGSAASAYLKLGEGCSNNCSYCSIPLIRGTRTSRPLKAVLTEARQLVEAGARELNLIAQDTTAYGLDRAGRSQLPRLLRELYKLPGPLWFRILYAHPRHLTTEILDTMAADDRVCPYLDLPLQHISDRMLKAMGRGYGRRRVEPASQALIGRLPSFSRPTTRISCSSRTAMANTATNPANASQKLTARPATVSTSPAIRPSESITKRRRDTR